MQSKSGKSISSLELVFREEAAARKPDPAPAQMALAHLGKSADQDVWFVEDSSDDWDCAKAVGCRPIRFDPMHAKRHELSDSYKAVGA